MCMGVCGGVSPLHTCVCVSVYLQVGMCVMCVCVMVVCRDPLPVNPPVVQRREPGTW